MPPSPPPSPAPSRRSLLGLAAALPALACPPLARAQGTPIQLRISTAATETDWLAQAMMRFKEGVERARPGAFAVAVHPTSSLFRQGTELPALQRGNLEMSTMTTFEVDQQLPELGAYSGGYVLRDHPHLRRVFDGPLGAEYAERVAAGMGVQLLGTVYLGTRQVNLRNPREVKLPADLRGVKLRMPPGPGWTALGRGLGVTPTPMPNPDVYLALKSGAIDGQENPLGLTRANNFHEVTQQLVLTAHLVQPVFLAFGKPFWDRLNPAQRDVLREQAKLAATWHDERRVADEVAVLEQFRAGGMKVATPNRDAFRDSVRKQYAEAGISQKWLPGLEDRIQAVA
ncbi:TRAP transporter substrate-binding protein DctP [Roseomonas sp. OT10]|uniref:TRAP transporter substrate-binding protein DctP n=1 Tax=Roseomonas cutis TaxID=2897332 RepID=UPI001E3FDC64|nr:TRAP transporter substrate-binding protein DctP [Roseomonas sp. OT10]UFN49687.1 TRAP transporter substrate-binding protein DctP [Roseomonas sp. OT10]